MATKKNEAYIEFKANTSEFQKGIKQMNAELKTASNELRLNATQLKGAGDSVDLLSDRQKILQNELEASTKKVDLTERSLAECKATLGENSKEYTNLKNAVLQAKNQQAAIQNELAATEKKLASLTSETKETKTAFDKLADEIGEQENELADLKRKYADLVLTQGKGSKESKELATQIKNLSSNLVDNKRELNNAENAADKLDSSLDELSDSAKDSGDGFTVAKGAISGFISNGLTALTGAISNAVSSVAELADETREYRSEMGKLDTAFETSGYSAGTARSAYSELYSIIGETDQSVEAAQQIALLAQSEEDVGKWAEYAAGLVGRFGDALQPETFYESANETLKLGEATGAYTQMLEGCGVNVEEFNEGLAACKTEGEKQAYMLETTEKLLGSASDAYKKTNEDIIAANEAQANYTDKLATLGEKVEPVTTTVKNGFSDILDKVIELTEGIDTEGISSAISGSFQTFIDETIPAIVDGFQWIVDNKDTLISGISAIGAAFAVFKVASLIQGVVTAIQSFKTAQEAATIAQAAFNAVANANPLGIIITVVAAVVAAIVAFVATNDDAKAKIAEIWENIKNAFSTAKEAIVGGFENFKQKIVDFKNKVKEIADKVINFVKENWQGLLLLIVNPFAGAFKLLYDNCEGFRETINNLKEKIVEIFTNLKEKAVELFEKIKSGIQEKITQAKNKAVELFNKMRSSIQEKITALKEKATAIFSQIKEKIITPITNAKNKAVELFNNLKSNAIDKINSLKSSVTSKFTEIKKKITDPIENARKTVKEQIDKIKGFFDKLKLTLPKIKLPHFKLTGEFSLEKKTVPKLSVEWYAKGGYFDKPTVLTGLGEAGPEYALPLNERSLTPLAVMLNKLTMQGENGLAEALASRFDSAIDKLADRLERLEANFYLDGEKVATATASYDDTQSGIRTQLTERGVTLK